MSGINSTGMNSQIQGIIDSLTNDLAVAMSASTGGLPPTQGGAKAPSTEGLPTLTPPSSGPLSLESLMDAIGFEQRKLACKTGIDSLEVKGEKQKIENDKQLAELKTQIEDMAKQEKLGPWKKAFQWIGMIVGAIASVASIVAGAITGNPLLIIGGAIGLTMSVNSIVSAATDGKVSIGAGVAALAEECGASEEAAQWIGMGVEMAIMIAGAVCSFSGALSSTSQASQATIKLVTKIATTLTTVIAGASQIGSSALNIYSATIDKDIADSKVNQKDIQAILERIKESMKFEEDMIEAEMQKANALLGMVADIGEGCREAQTAILTGAPSMA